MIDAIKDTFMTLLESEVALKLRSKGCVRVPQGENGKRSVLEEELARAVAGEHGMHKRQIENQRWGDT